jgi:Rad3-related DNA helicase
VYIYLVLWEDRYGDSRSVVAVFPSYKYAEEYIQDRMADKQYVYYQYQGTHDLIIEEHLMATA